MSKNDWTTWLSVKKSEYLIQIREAVKALHSLSENEKPLAFYTPHGPTHFQMVEDNLHKLIPDMVAEKELVEEERFYLLASAWLHDLGMYRSVVFDVYGEHLEDNEIRERHHLTSSQFITSYFDKCGVKEIDKEFLATLCMYHRRKENIEVCPTMKSVGVNNKSFRIKLLAAYLRLADSLDIGSYRTTTPAYAISLAYNIPQESKMHWIKNRVISGVFIDAEKHKIRVEFSEPKIYDKSNFNTSKFINEKLDYVIDLVMQDLHEELNSVKQILISYGISYFLEIIQTKNAEFVSEQTTNDLVEMVANYDILVHPSASKLLEMILLTVANISGYHLNKYDRPQKYTSNRSGTLSKIVRELKDFLSKINTELVSSRPCHYGLTNLIRSCEEYVDLLESNESISDFINKVSCLYSAHHKYRQNIRLQSSSFFEKKYLTGKKENNKFYIVLYGYSELAIKAICGFRDSLILEKYPGVKPKDFYNNKLETDFSDHFTIFICEGQPKTITASQDKLIYHDGIRYAEALRQRNFLNVVMIPDATIGNIYKNFDIDLILVGANGFDREHFVHSSGHASIINLGLYHKISNDKSKPLIVLATTKEKFMTQNPEKQTKKSKNVTTDGSNELNVSFFEDTKVESREKVWFLRDIQVLKRLCNNSIALFNPREDQIPIRDLDFIITENGWYQIKGDSEKLEDTQQNIDNFITAQQVDL